MNYSRQNLKCSSNRKSSFSVNIKKRTLDDRGYVHALVQVEIGPFGAFAGLPEFSCMFFRPEENGKPSKRVYDAWLIEPVEINHGCESNGFGPCGEHPVFHGAVDLNY